MRTALLSLLGSLAVLSGCGSDKPSTKQDEDERGGGAEKLAEGISQSRQGDEKLTEYDLNRDSRPDVFVFTVPSRTEDGREYDRLVRKELDLNWDGKVDISRSYGEREQVESEKLDLDFDGKVDQVNFYEKGTIVRKERDVGYTGRPNTWIFYEKGKIVRKERDADGDGKVDYWEYWEAVDGREQVDRVGEDLDGDGNVDRWTKNPNTSQE